MADRVNEMLERFTALSLEEKQISAEMDSAAKEYNDYCASSDADMNAKIQEIREKMGKLQYYISYAREHAQASDLEEASMAFETPMGTLESIRQTIKLDSKHDENAETLYVKATGQRKFYEEKIEQTRKLIEGSKVQAKRQYDSDLAAINDRRFKHEAKVKEYVESDEFKSYLKLLTFDSSAFNSTGTVTLHDKSYISIGQRRVKLSVPMEIEQDLVLSSGGQYNSAAHTIGAPQHIPMNKGSVLMLDYDERNTSYLMGGIQRLLLNIIKYYGMEISEMLFCEPYENNPDSLGSIALLAKGINPYIIVPQSVEEGEKRIAELCARAEAFPTGDRVSRVIVLHGFPEMYGGDTKERVRRLCSIADRVGALVVLTHDNSIPEEDPDRELHDNALSVRSRNGGFWIEKLRESLFWYSAPSELPEDVRKVYVEQRRQQATMGQTAPNVSVAVASPTPVGVPASIAAPTVNVVPPVQTVQTPPPVQAVQVPPAQTAAPVPPVQETVQAEPKNENVNADQEAPAEEHNDAFGEEQAHIPEHIADENDVPEKIADDGDEVKIGDFDPEEHVYKLPKAVLGTDANGHQAVLDLNGDITYICGTKSADRSNVTKAVIGAITSKCHPDVTELWFFDQTGEFEDIASNLPPHIRYYIADNAVQTAFDLTDVLSEFIDTRNTAFKENGRASIEDVHIGEEIPQIVVIINEFPEMCDRIEHGTKFFGRNYVSRLVKLMRGSARLGFHFILTGENFASCLKASDVYSAAATSCRSGTVGDLFGSYGAAGSIAATGRIPSGSVFAASNDSALTAVIEPREIRFAEYTEASDYTHTPSEYIYKTPIVSIRTTRMPFADRSDLRQLSIEERDPDETLLFLGEPCRFLAEYPVRLYKDYGENLLAVMPARERRNAIYVVLAAIMSLREQDINPEILAFRSNPMYVELLSIGVPEGITVYEGNDAVARVREISAAVNEGGNMDGTFEIILGGDLLIAAMQAENCESDLQNILVKGVRLGVHCLFGVTDMSKIGTAMTVMFKYRLAFACPEFDAVKVLRDMVVELPENAFRYSNDFEELTMMPYIL